MLTEYEAQKMRREMARELAGSPTIVVACGAGLLIVAVLFLLVGRLALQQEAEHGARAGTAPAAIQRYERASITETRRLMEERRKRFEARPAVRSMPSAEAAALEGIPEVDAFTLSTRASD
jgi:hypothetical protein